MTICSPPLSEVESAAAINGTARPCSTRRPAKDSIAPVARSAVLRLSGQVRQRQQVERRHRRRRRLGAVVVFLGSQQHRRVGAGRAEPTRRPRHPRTARPAGAGARAPTTASRRRRRPERARADPRSETRSPPHSRRWPCGPPGSVATGSGDRAATSNCEETTRPSWPSPSGAGGVAIASRSPSSSEPPDSTRAARANAAIISPFHAVSTLSSRCGLGRWRRTSNRACRARINACATARGSRPLVRAKSAIDRAVCSRFF